MNLHAVADVGILDLEPGRAHALKICWTASTSMAGRGGPPSVLRWRRPAPEQRQLLALLSERMRCVPLHQLLGKTSATR
jgi:hypothetical protein